MLTLANAARLKVGQLKKHRRQIPAPFELIVEEGDNVVRYFSEKATPIYCEYVKYTLEKNNLAQEVEGYPDGESFIFLTLYDENIYAVLISSDNECLSEVNCKADSFVEKYGYELKKTGIVVCFSGHSREASELVGSRAKVIEIPTHISLGGVISSEFYTQKTKSRSKLLFLFPLVVFAFLMYYFWPSKDLEPQNVEDPNETWARSYMQGLPADKTFLKLADTLILLSSLPYDWIPGTISISGGRISVELLMRNGVGRYSSIRGWASRLPKGAQFEDGTLSLDISQVENVKKYRLDDYPYILADDIGRMGASTISLTQEQSIVGYKKWRISSQQTLDIGKIIVLAMTLKDKPVFIDSISFSSLSVGPGESKADVQMVMYVEGV
ncbi:hypothetical protein [Shewanella algae]|uniref:hypothetical protein n=1 Tax=Shewanella algae TaxID=38313 RepID=UPI001C58A334|nr:hypothetical protein [Shewanella algae]